MAEVLKSDRWLSDPKTGSITTFASLQEVLAVGRVTWRPFLKPHGVDEAFLGIVAALVCGADITLVDSDFSVDELTQLGIQSGDLEVRREGMFRFPGASMTSVLDKLFEDPRGTISLFTSGSTGLPKVVKQPIRNLLRNVRRGERYALDVWGFCYNPTHIAGVQVFFQALFNLNPIVNLFGVGNELIDQAIIDNGVTHLSATPTFYRLLCTSGRSFPNVRSVTLGGERTDASLLERLRTSFPNARFRNVYASTEAGTVLSAEGDVFSVAPAEDHVVRVQEGQLMLHKSLLGEFQGALSRVEEWYATGDVVEVLQADPLRFRFLSRERDWVNVGGQKVNTAEVEKSLLEHPGVMEARVFGRPNALMGAIVCAEVRVGDTSCTEKELRAFLSSRLQEFKIPRIIKMVAEFATTRTGKLKRL